jgi:hypothetical protein
MNHPYLRVGRHILDDSVELRAESSRVGVVRHGDRRWQQAVGGDQRWWRCRKRGDGQREAATRGEVAALEGSGQEGGDDPGGRGQRGCSNP